MKKASLALMLCALMAATGCKKDATPTPAAPTVKPIMDDPFAPPSPPPDPGDDSGDDGSQKPPPH